MFDFLQKQGATQELAELVLELARAVEEFPDDYSHEHRQAGSTNVYGEEQIAMDVKADEIWTHPQNQSLSTAYCSEELDALNPPAKAESLACFTIRSMARPLM